MKPLAKTLGWLLISGIIGIGWGMATVRYMKQPQTMLVQERRYYPETAQYVIILKVEVTADEFKRIDVGDEWDD